MGRRLAALLFACGCYGPTVATGIPCSSTRECPNGQVCAANSRCELPGHDGGIDAHVVDTMTPDGFTFTGWSPPKPLVELNTLSVETDPTITADGLDIVFASDRPGGLGGQDLYRASRTSITAQFGTPVLIAELSTPAADQAAELSGDGLTIYLKKSGGVNEDVFSARRQTRSGLFDTPTLEPTLSSTTEADTNPSISRDGLIFSTSRGTTDREMFIFKRTTTNSPWSAQRQLTELSTPTVDSGAAFDQTGLVIVFHSDRNSAVADREDLFVATRASTNDPFGPAVPIAELDTTTANESDASFTTDLRYIVFECASDLCFSSR